MSLLDQVVPEVANIKRNKANAAAAKAKEEARRNSYLPKTAEERFRLIYPFIFESKKYKAEVTQDRHLYFTVGGERFGIWEEYVPAYEGSSDDGYAYAHDSYWRPEIHICNPNEYAVSFGPAGDISNGDLINAKDPKRSAKERKETQQFIDEQVKKFEKDIAATVKGHLLKKDDYRYREELRRIGSGR